MDENEIEALRKRLKRATDLLREWRDKYGGKEHHAFLSPYGSKTASTTDLLTDTRHFLEGR